MKIYVNIKQIGKRKNKIDKKEYEIKGEIETVKDLLIEFVTINVNEFNNGFTENVIFNGFDVAIEDGEFVAIHGRSGCGKSTLLNIIGLIDSMSEGTYILDGKDISKLKPSEYAAIRNRDIGFIFQAFHLLQDESVIYNVSLPMKYAKVDKASRKERAEALLKLVGLEGKENNKALQLSGGEMQRVAVARALANNPKYILADEPTGNLDIENRDIIMDLLKTINEKNGSTIIMVTHSLRAASYANRVLFIKDGVVYHEIYRGENERQSEFMERINQAQFMLNRGEQ